MILHILWHFRQWGKAIFVPVYLALYSLYCRALIPLMDYNSVRGFKGQPSQRWDDLSMLYLSHSGETLALRCARSRRGVWTWKRGPTMVFCHVNIIQSDVWVICLPILITSHINSYHQDVHHPTFWASEEISIWICNHVSFKLHHIHGQEGGDN